MKTLFVLLLSFGCVASQAGIYITVSGANVKRAKIAIGQVHPLPDATTVDPALAKKVREQVQSDLEFENLFDFVNEALFTAYDSPKDLYSVKYPELSQLGASFMLKLGYKIEAGKLFLEALLYDIPGQKKIFGTRYQYPSNQYPRLVHAMAEDVLRELTGEKGLFFSRLVMVCRDKRKKVSPPKDIWIVDTDGRNATQLTTDNTLSLSPSWSPDGKYIVYTQFEFRAIRGIKKKAIVLKKHNLTSGERKVLSAMEGMNSGGSWAPNGAKIVATLSFSGRPEMYFLDPNGIGGEPEPVSRNIQWKRAGSDTFQATPASMLFDVEPTWSPDSSKLVFSSRRTGSPNIYILDVSSKIATQLTFAGSYNATPAWSPKGDKILFAAQLTKEGHFDLFSIDPDGNNLQRITDGSRKGKRINSENPTWAPTGRHFAYGSNEGGSYGIYVSTLDGSIKRKVSPPDHECTTPSWGPAEVQ